MCTSLTLKTDHFYVGRNLDLEYHFGERVVLTPRGYTFAFRKKPERRATYAMIGMANVTDNYPLYAEAVNEKGLYIAGLYFPGNAYYPEEEAAGKDNISPFELIPWILSQCTDVDEAEALLDRMHLIGIPFKKELPLTALHWHIADRNRSIVLESMKDGLHRYDNPAGVLTNNPPFPFHMENLRQYMGLGAKTPENLFGGGKLPLRPFGQGMGAIGLPGDCSPASRFVRIAFHRANSAPKTGEAESVSQFFHLLGSVAMTAGSVVTPEGLYDRTTYSCCIDADRGIYYYTTYENCQITAIRMDRENLDGSELKEFPLVGELQIREGN